MSGLLQDVRLAFRILARDARGVHCGRPLIGAGHRRQHDPLLPHQQLAAAAARGAQPPRLNRASAESAGVQLRHVGRDARHGCLRGCTRICATVQTPRRHRGRGGNASCLVAERRRFHDARSPGCTRPRLHGPRRRAGRWPEWAGGRHQLSDLAAPPWRLTCRRGYAHHDRARPVHDCRRDAA